MECISSRLFCVVFVVDELNKGVPFFESLYWLVILLVLLTVFTLWVFIRNNKRLIISDEGIDVAKKKFKWDELRKIEFMGKRSYDRVLTETLKFVSVNGDSICVMHDTIGNISEICQALEHIKNQISEGAKPSLKSFTYSKENISNVRVTEGRTQAYGKGRVFSLNGIILVYALGMFVAMCTLFIRVYSTKANTPMILQGAFNKEI